MHKRMLAAVLGLCLLLPAVGCKKEEDSELYKNDDTLGAYIEEIPVYDSGSEAVNANFQEDLKALSKTYQEAFNPAENQDYTFNPDVSEVQTAKYITLIVDTSTENANRYVPFVYRKDTGERVALEDLLSDEDYAQVPALIEEYFKESSFYGSAEFDQKFEDNIMNFLGFGVTQETIQFYYSTGQLFATAYDAPIAEIDYKKFKKPIEI